jgi:bifunctional non-homologous end joining protein LigD
MVQLKRPVMPGFVETQRPRPVATPPSDAAWGHEIKLGGYRVQLHVADGAATLYGEDGGLRMEWLGDFAAVAVNMPDCIVDAELCAVAGDGQPNRALLRSVLAHRQFDDLVLFAFDLLWLGREDQRPKPLQDRKALLREVVQAVGQPGRLAYVQTFTGVSGQALLDQACVAGLDGIVSKRLDAAYDPGNGESWTCAECRPGQTVVIGGWKTWGARIVSLLVGVHEDGRLRYAGAVRDGIGRPEAQELQARLAPLAATASPFTAGDPPRPASDVHWARPELVADVEVREWTPAGKLRKAVYLGLRDDKLALAVVRKS